jgi:ribosomal protein L37AE/L43A
VFPVLSFPNLGNGSQEKGTPASNDGTPRTLVCAQPQRWSVMVRKGHKVKPSALASESHYIICPSCEAGELRSAGHNGVQCSLCDYAPSRAVLEALQQIITLPDALGSHACEECAHPEMRCLPDGILHCPGCGSEVLPTISKCPTRAVSPSRGHRQFDGGHLDAPPAPKKSSQRSLMRAPEGGEP